jgi:hypothetical protein
VPEKDREAKGDRMLWDEEQKESSRQRARKAFSDYYLKRPAGVAGSVAIGLQ